MEALLGELGLAKNEIKVYLALLSLKQSTTTPLVKKSLIPNSKIYPVLDSLINKGLASYIIKNNKKHFQPAPPEHLYELLSEKEALLAKQKQALAKTIEQIKQTTVQDTQQASVYEGYNGVRQALEGQLQYMKRGEYYYVLSMGLTLEDKNLIRFLTNYHVKRVAKGIKVKLLSTETHKEMIKKVIDYKLMEKRYISFELPAGIFIYKKTIITYMWGERPTAFVIDSEQNAGQYRQFFEDLWKQAKP